MARKPDRITPDSLDFDRPASLIRLAYVSRIDALLESRGTGRMRRVDVANELDMDAQRLSRYLSVDGIEGDRDSGDRFAQRLQGYLQAYEGRLGEAGGELVGFRRHLLARTVDSPIIHLVGLRVPSRFFGALAEQPARSVPELLTAGAALVAVRQQASTAQIADDLRRVIGGDRVDHIIEQLVVTTGMPHVHWRMTITILARLGHWTPPLLKRHLEESPLGYRSLRLVTRMLRDLPARRDDGQEAIRRLLMRRLQVYPERTGHLNIDPARGFYEEALRFTPVTDPLEAARPGGERLWDEEWVPERLARTATDPRNPTRQRSFAALCLGEGGEPQRRHALALLEAFRSEGANQPDGGLVYAAQSIERIMDWRETVARMGHGVRPKPQPPCWVGTDAARQLEELPWLDDWSATPRQPVPGVAGTVREATQRLIRWALLSPDITLRRTACDTINAAGVAAPAGAVIGRVIQDDRCPGFLREVGAAVLGYLGHRAGVPTLTALLDDTALPAGTRRTAVLALGDLWIPPGGDGDDLRTRAVGALLNVLEADDSEHHAVALSAIATRGRLDAATRGLTPLDARVRQRTAELRERYRASADARPGDRGARVLAMLAAWAVAQLQAGAMPVNPLRLDE